MDYDILSIIFRKDTDYDVRRTNKRIRTFRGLTQRELGLKLGYEERNADVRVAQYESGYRVPKKIH